MALKGKYSKEGLVCAQAYARVDNINGGKDGFNVHVSISSQPPAKDDDGNIVNRFGVVEHFTVFAPYVKDEDIFQTAYAAVSADERLAGFKAA